MTDLEVYRPAAELAVPLVSDIDSWITVVDDVIKVANAIYDTPFVPDGLRGSVTAVAACILAGREMGIGPMTSLQNIHVIKGKPGQSALLMRSLIQSKGHKWEDVDVSDTRVVVKGCRKGESAWMEASFTADQARKAGIDLGKYPQDKLYARASVRLARRKFADVIMGMPYSEEDLEDGDGGESAPAAIEAPKPAPAQRTARRGRGAPQTASPAAAPTPPAPAGEAPLPPLPGEEPDPTEGPQQDTGSSPSGSAVDDTDYDTPGTVTTPQITAIWTVLSNVYKFTKDEKDQARAVCAHVIGHELASTKDMSKNEGKAVLDTLANWREVAEQHETEPREFLVQLLATEAQGADNGAA